MTTFLSELSSKLADRWAATLVAPGLLYLTVVTLALWLGQGHALDLAAVRSHVNGIAASPGSHSTGTVLIAATGVLAGSVGASLAAAVIGKLIERAWLLPGTRPPLRSVRRWRERRWATATRQIEQSADEEPAENAPSLDLATIAARSKAAIARRNAISLVSPERPTWIGDRLRAVDVRVWAAYRLDLAVVWPHLWSIATPELRTDLSAAQDAYAGAARLGGWGLLCLAVAPWWWPATLIATIIFGTAWNNARSAAEMLASLAETATDLHGRDLAAKLGIACEGPLTADIGLKIMTQLRKASNS